VDGGLTFSGIQGSSTVSYYAGAGSVPSLTSSTPSNGAQLARGTTALTLVFDQDVVAAATNLLIMTKGGAAASTPKLTDVVATDTDYVSISSGTVTINVASSVFGTGGECYCLTVPNGALKSVTSGQAYGGTVIEFCVAFSA